MRSIDSSRIVLHRARSRKQHGEQAAYRAINTRNAALENPASVSKRVYPNVCMRSAGQVATYEVYRLRTSPVQSNSIWKASETRPKLLVHQPYTISTNINPKLIVRKAAIRLACWLVRMCLRNSASPETGAAGESRLPARKYRAPAIVPAAPTLVRPSC